jgi:RNA polymerase sigma-70 factor (ECF subfamily)
MQAPSIDPFGRHFAEAKAGDDHAVNELVNDVYAPLTAFFDRRGVQDPESSANDAIERAIRNGDPDRIDSSPAFRAFLYAIARNQAKNEFRSRDTRVDIDLVEDPPVDLVLSAPSAEAIVFEERGAEELLAQVKPAEAEVLELRFLDGYTVKETATIVGKSFPAVNALQRRGLARLRQVAGVAVAVLIVIFGVRASMGADERGPVISEDHQSEIGELPAPVDDRSENGAPLLLETDDGLEADVDSDVDKLGEDIPAAVASAVEVVVAPTPQAQFLLDLQAGLERGLVALPAEESYVEPPHDIRVPSPGAAAEPVAPVTVNLPEAPVDDAVAELQPIWIPTISPEAEIPAVALPPLLQPIVPEDAGQPVGPAEPDMVETTPTTSTTTTTTTTTAPPPVVIATGLDTSEDDGSGFIPEAVSHPVGDAFGALKSLVSKPVDWIDQGTSAIDVTN